MMTQKWRGWVLAGIALTMYVTGGVLIMAGLVMIGIMGGQDVWGWGEAGFCCRHHPLCCRCAGHADYAQQGLVKKLVPL
jgi:hypothetical protein